MVLGDRHRFPVGLEVNRDFPEAYLDVQKLSEEAPWKRISCHGKCRTCHKTLLEEETQPCTQYGVRQRLLSLVSKRGNRETSPNVATERVWMLRGCGAARSATLAVMCSGAVGQYGRMGYTFQDVQTSLSSVTCLSLCNTGDTCRKGGNFKSTIAPRSHSHMVTNHIF